MAQYFAARSAAWTKYLVEGFSEESSKIVKCWGDNDQATRLAQEDMMTSENRYYQTMYYWTKEAQGRTIDCDRVDTNNNVSDLLTKAADKPTCDRLQPRLTGRVEPKGDIPRFSLQDFKYEEL